MGSPVWVAGALALDSRIRMDLDWKRSVQPWCSHVLCGIPDTEPQAKLRPCNSARQPGRVILLDHPSPCAHLWAILCNDVLKFLIKYTHTHKARVVMPPCGHICYLELEASSELCVGSPSGHWRPWRNQVLVATRCPSGEETFSPHRPLHGRLQPKAGFLCAGDS